VYLEVSLCCLEVGVLQWWEQFLGDAKDLGEPWQQCLDERWSQYSQLPSGCHLEHPGSARLKGSQSSALSRDKSEGELEAVQLRLWQRRLEPSLRGLLLDRRLLPHFMKYLPSPLGEGC